MLFMPGVSNTIDASKSKSRPAVAIVVTYNRKQSVIEVINALLNQTLACDIIIVDNASSDGTKVALDALGLIDRQEVHYIYLEENQGGSGGFFHGLEYAIDGSWQWFWLMDDDAMPEPDALQNLSKYADDPETVYGSAAINRVDGKTKLCWPAITKQKGRKRFVEFPDMLADLEEVDMIPFLGFFIHRNLVARIGYPDPDFFICADDKEYCERIKAQNGNLALVKSSKISHPLARIVIYDFGLFQAAYRSLPPWKIYYDVRNKILIANKYFPYRVWTQTLPGIFWRGFLSMFKEESRGSVLAMTLKAVVDGILNRKGKIVLPPSC
jgi:rhamnopyranosyl-N-acetylglucosaminyl-diphospho-decaprenol beta-1,3/1,4-galactofuranosyltransferase